MKNKTIITMTFLLISFICNSQISDLNLRNINNEKFKEKCLQKFCKNLNSKNCIEKMQNLEIVLNLIKTDKRINNIHVASFILATIYTETEIKNFSPTSEVKCKGNENRKYWIPDPITGQQYYGRGWVQLTHKENYKKATDSLKIDFINHPDLLLDPKNAYEVLYLSTINGWLETYRSNENGAAGFTKIKLQDFMEETKDEEALLDYSLVRAIINANGGSAKRFEYKKGYFIPKSENLDASKKTEDMCIFFENAIRYSLCDLTYDKIMNEPKKLHILKNLFYNQGCYIYNRGSNGEIYANLNNKYVYWSQK